jgi:hypothetical protein
VIAEIPEGSFDDDDVEQSPGWDGPITVNPTTEGDRFTGRNNATAAFIADHGAPVAGGDYRQFWTADLSQLRRLGREAMIGIGFKLGGAIYIVGVRGDGTVAAIQRDTEAAGDFDQPNS